MPNESFFVRRATKDDACLVANMGARLFRNTFGQDNCPENMERYLALSFSPAKIEAELGDLASTFLLAYEAHHPIGYAKLRNSQKPDCVRGSQPLELVRLYVDQSVIGKGYGSTLIRSCFEVADGMGYQTIWLGVWEKNARAIRFYQKWGFFEVGCQNFVLGSDVQNDLIMERSVELAR